MRPQVLYPLFAEVTALAGIGPRLAKPIERLAGARVVDLCWHLPSGLIDRRYRPRLAEARVGRLVTLELSVGTTQIPRSKRQPFRVTCFDEGTAVDLVFFHTDKGWLNRLLPEGSKRLVSGKLEYYSGALQIAHPDHVLPLEKADSLPPVEPIYPMTAGLTPKVLQRAIAGALNRVPEALPEWQNGPLLQARGLPSFRDALTAAHRPDDEADLSPLALPRQRLALDELLANQLALALVRQRQRRKRGRVVRGDGRLRSRVLSVLPYRPTGAQHRAIEEILSDMAGERRMLRLLQGDVGSGKTLVALMAMLTAAECGGQAALMAPTEILARQHLHSLQPLAAAAGVGIELLVGRDRSAARGDTLARIAAGASQLIVGTHALFQEEVAFRGLLLAVIDEQHRFGVHQRLALAKKGSAVDILVMTATPIPRTLTMTLYGDMDVSRLDEKPPGRQPVDTRALPLSRLDDVVEGVGRALCEDRKVYWICPLVEASDDSDLAAAKERFAHLKTRFPGKVGLVHGRLPGKEKDKTMQAFAEGPLSLLIATTVIEVGVNVPEATIVVLEHAERFGLSQLHQLRGRVGRGSGKSSCLLLYQPPLGKTARARLETLRNSEDGFLIAEEDLRLRGAGEILGTRQSGLPHFRLADLTVHGELMAASRDDARRIVDSDSELKGPRGKALRLLLYLFGRDEAIQLLSSG
ncbi:MAG: ATP-dependent DNA helicase RecG [Rhodospirillales bacterium]|nr:ATP-dependent DNA helicase RecG [Rhodospirillales bacterium]